MSPARLSALCLVCLTVVALVAPRAAAQPAVAFMSPSAVAPGAPADVVIYGDNLAGATGLWTGIPAAVELTPGVEGNGNQPKEVRYRITFPAETPVGIYGYRLGTSGGVSNLRLLMVDDLPTVADNGQNKTPETAQLLTLPVAVEGACEPESFDFYKFNAAAGETVSVDAVARRLGSPLDPVVRLLDAAGKELAFSDDEGGIAPDGRFAYTFNAPGEYYVEIRDITYAGSGGHRYRLRIGNFPLATVAYPTGIVVGSTTALEPVAPLLAAGLATTVTVGAQVGSQVPAAARYATGQGAVPVTLMAATGSEQVEFEPNDDVAGGGSPVLVPGAISGRFAAAGDHDLFGFDAKAGQRLLFVGMTRSLGSPTDLLMRVMKPDGGVLAEVDDSGTEEGTLDFTAPADGRYLLAVEDLHHRGGPQHVYRVDVQPYQPGFSLSLEAEKFDVPLGGVMVIKVNAARRDYNGPITLSLEDVGEGFGLNLTRQPSSPGYRDVFLASNVIPEGKNDVVLSLTFPASIAQGPPRVGRIVGRAKIGEVDFAATASTLGALRPQFAGLPYPPPMLDGSVGIGVGPAFGDFFKLSLEGDTVRFPQLVGTGTGKVKLEKLAGFDDVVNLAVEGLPAGFTAELPAIAKGQTEAAIIVRGPAAAAAGDYRFRIVGSGVLSNQPKSVTLEAILRVGRPLDVAAAPAGPVVAGATQKCKISLTRFGDEKQPVQLSFVNLPPGLSVPEGLAIAADAAELEFDLTAAANAGIGSFPGVQVVATTTVGGKQVTSSAVFALEVKMP
ncbi:MAG: PPC domain-containing protein [Pirellulales bacterium]|nr:PPC domain-containing protein [Pirellulales bacterium]